MLEAVAKHVPLDKVAGHYHDTFGQALANIYASLETGVEGVFAVGDVRCGSVKRVGAAIGEGAAVVAQLHTFLAGRDPTATGATPGGFLRQR